MIELKSRDIEFLKDLFNVKYLNTKRILRLYSISYKSCMRRLKQLETNGCIKKVDYIGKGENVYCITRRGCCYLCYGYSYVGKTDKLNHYLACGDFYFSVKDKGVKELIFEQQYYFNHNGKKYSFRPDLVVCIDRWYFVEIDLCGRRFESKVKVWENFYLSGAFKKYFNKYPPIIIVSVDVGKVKGVISRCESVGLNYIYKDYDEVKEWECRH